MAKVGAIKHVIMREADAIALREIAYRYGLVSDSAAIRLAIHELARRIEDENRQRRGGHAFIPLSGSQDAGGRYTRCGVDGCDLAPEQHS